MNESAAAGIQSQTLTLFALDAVELMAIALIVLVLLDALYLTGLGIYLTRSGRRRAGMKAAALALGVASVCSTAAPLAAQAPGQEVRVVQPQFTRLFGSDSIEITNTALSPDGRWIVFDTYEAQKGSLWVVSAAGGEPIPLTTGAHNDGNPVFFPSGDRIAFRSDRPSRPGELQMHVMVIPFDTRTGRGGTPRQVSLEPTFGQALAVSPDGEWIAYTVRADTLLMRLMVVPSTGGTARALAEFGSSVIGIQNLEWSGDGRFVYFSLRGRGTETRRVMRAPLAQGSVQEVGTANRLIRVLFPDRGLMVVQVGQVGSPGTAPSFEVTTLDGRTVARFSTQRNMQLVRPTPDGRGLVASRSNIVAPVRVVPVAGGPARQLTEALEYDWPLGWSADGSQLYVGTRINGQAGILRLPLNGGPATQWPVPRGVELRAFMTPDGSYVTYAVDSAGGERTLGLLRLSDGRATLLTRNRHYGALMVVTGPGGSPGTDENEFVYLELRGERLELRSTPPEGPSRLLRAFPASYAGATGFGVHGSRIAYTERRGDSTAVFVAEGPSGRARHLVTVAGSAMQPVWSHDGRRLAFDHYPRGQAPGHDVLLIDIGPGGTVAGAPRVLESGAFAAWQIEWLPDDRALTVFAMTGRGNETHVILVSLREGERPVAVTRDDPSTRWGYSLSPDGRHVAYPAEIPRGSSIWRVDLGDVLAGSGNPRR